MQKKTTRLKTTRPQTKVNKEAFRSGVPTNVTSIALGPGEWEVTGIVTLKYTSATQSADGQAGLNVLSATLPGDNVRGFDNTRHTATTSNASKRFRSSTLIARVHRRLT